jgi:drug/metabolite transporter (DMT)-like permease
VKNYRGLLAVIFSAVIYGTVPYFAKTIYSYGGNPISLIFSRGFLSLPLLYYLAKRSSPESLTLTFDQWKKLIFLVLFGYVSTAFLLYTSYNYIPTGIATVLHFSYPVFVAIGLVIFYREKPTKAVLLALIVSFIGILLINDTKSSLNLTGFLMALGSGLTYSFFIIYVKKSGLNQLNLFKLTFYLALVASFIYLLFGLLSHSLAFDIGIKGWILTLLLSNIVAVGGVYLFQVGIRLIGPQKTSILSTLEPITSIAIGVMIFSEILALRSILGILFILSTVIIIVRSENKN